jgi:hypothetical protein
MFPRMADNMEYSPLAASEPKGKFESKLTSKIESEAEKGSQDCIEGGSVLLSDLDLLSCSSSCSSRRYFAFLRRPSVQFDEIPRLIHLWQGLAVLE